MKKENHKTPKAPFVYFGGKNIVAPFVWRLFGQYIKRYFEPFAGSLAVLLARKREKGKIYHDIANDIDCLVINVWRALKHDANKLAEMCAEPISHVLLWQRICCLLREKDALLKKMIVDDEYFNTKLAAYWLYMKATEIGGSDIDKQSEERVLENINGGLLVARPQILGASGIHSFQKKNKNLKTCSTKKQRLLAWFNELMPILENTKFLCCDWKRLFNEGTMWQDERGTKNIAIFFDPPYSDVTRRKSLYRIDSFDVAKEVNDFCVKHANKKTYRIVVAGYEGEHNNLENHGYTKYVWHTQAGYSNRSGSDNKTKERLWASKSCNNVDLVKKTINEYIKNSKA